MRTITNIVVSPTEPGIDNIWLKDGQMYYYEGGWKPIGGTSGDLTPSKLEESVEDSDTLFGKKDVIVPWDTLNADSGSITIADNLEEGATLTDDQRAYVALFNHFSLWITVPGKSEHSSHYFVFSASENKFIDTIMMGKRIDDYDYTFYTDPFIRKLSWTRVPY